MWLQLRALALWTWTLAQAHWPGALTLILPSHSGGTLALRASPHPVPAALIAGLGRPITSSSANRTGDPPPRHLGDAGWFGPQGPDAAVDGGPTAGRVGSTIVDCCGPAPRLVRRGDLAPDELACAVEERADG